MRPSQPSSTLTIPTLLFDKIDDPSSMGLCSLCMHVMCWLGRWGRKIVVILIFNVIILVSLSYYGTGGLGQIQQWIIDFFPLHFTLESRKICSGLLVVATKALLQRERDGIRVENLLIRLVSISQQQVSMGFEPRWFCHEGISSFLISSCLACAYAALATQSTFAINITWLKAPRWE